jgi:hypothetical protein
VLVVSAASPATLSEPRNTAETKPVVAVAPPAEAG